MNKDVIYIDVEDDITTIVGKIKDSKEKIIALVPPNRVGVLQSAINMRLLQRTAESVKKRVVLITNSQSLIGLAAAAKIPVARTLQSKPELVSTPVIKMDDDDIIDGQTMPIGELAGSVNRQPGDDAVDALIGSTAISAIKPDDDRSRFKKLASNVTGGKSAGSKVKVPNFSKFRKKLFLIIGASVLLVGFLVWAIWFAPRATVIISAKTTSATIDKSVSLVAGNTVDTNGDTLKAIRQEQKQDLSVEFQPTGKKEAGEYAAGRVRFSSGAILDIDRTIPAGTVLTSSSGKKYETSTSATLAISGGVATGTAQIKAVERGTSSNGATGALKGAPGSVSAQLTDATAGGTDKEVTVVSESDVAKAAEKLNEKKDDSLRGKLEQAFGSSSVVIAESYREARSDYQPSVPVDGEASGTVTLNSTVTGSMVAIDKADIKNYLKKNIEEEIADVKSQRIYEDGSKDVKFAQFTDRDGNMAVRLTANGKVGPSVDDSSVKEQSRGKTYGEIQPNLESISGVDNVDIKFWPFWVRTVPDDVKRIGVEFKLQDAS